MVSQPFTSRPLPESPIYRAQSPSCTSVGLLFSRILKLRYEAKLPLGWAYEIQVYLQTCDRLMQRVAVHAEFIGSLGLISSFLPKNNQHERLLEFSDRLIEMHTGAVHLLHD